jgi:hypothetical protein
VSELPDILIVCAIALAVVLPVVLFAALGEIESDDENTKRRSSADSQHGGNNGFSIRPEDRQMRRMDP